MINYDDLRKKAEAIMPDDEGNYDYGLVDDVSDEILDYLAATTPAKTLRLLRIIEDAKQSLIWYSKVTPFSEVAGKCLERIAKIENE